MLKKWTEICLLRIMKAGQLQSSTLQSWLVIKYHWRQPIIFKLFSFEVMMPGDWCTQLCVPIIPRTDCSSTLLQWLGTVKDSREQLHTINVLYWSENSGRMQLGKCLLQYILPILSLEFNTQITLHNKEKTFTVYKENPPRHEMYEFTRLKKPP